ncbi:MAG: hypothetical protein JRF69_02330, partial [Deltaproteobacteria bacterium]|nr:hypothetical protein [Deltaproteobacteria bacterium]
FDNFSSDRGYAAVRTPYPLFILLAHPDSLLMCIVVSSHRLPAHWQDDLLRVINPRPQRASTVSFRAKRPPWRFSVLQSIRLLIQVWAREKSLLLDLMEPQDFSRKLGDVHDIMTFYDWQGFAGRECYNVMDVP